MNEIQSLLSGCRDRRQQAVTVDSPIMRTSNWMSVEGALQLDLSRMNSVNIDFLRRLAIVGPGTKISSLVTAAHGQNMMADIEPIACIDFTFGDWAHESLRLLSTINSGLDGILRNVKVVAPDTTFQTGYDNFPANGGGYDLTKMYMTSFLTLGVPYEFSVPLRPIPDVMTKKIYSFKKPGDAINAGIQMHKTGYARIIKVRAPGFESMMTSGDSDPKSKEVHLVAKFEGPQSIVDIAEKALDEIAKNEGGNENEKLDDVSKFFDPASINPNAWILGVCLCDTTGLASIINDLATKASDGGKSFQFCVSDLDSNVSVLVPLVEGPVSPDLVRSIGSHLVDHRMTLRGNVAWNSLLGDSRSSPRIELVARIKRYLDSQMILNTHMMGVL